MRQRQDSIESAVAYYTEEGYEVFQRDTHGVQMRKAYGPPEYGSEGFTYVAIWQTTTPSDYYNGCWIEQGAIYSEEY